MEPQTASIAPGSSGAAGESLPSPDGSPAAAIGDSTVLASGEVGSGLTVRADVTLLGIDQLLELPLEIGAPPPALDKAAAAFPIFHDDDLPAPLFDEADLPVPVFDDADLPAPLLDQFDLPADLTAVDLGQLLALRLAGGNLPTVGEVVQIAARAGASVEEDKPDPDDDAKDDPEADDVDPETDPSGQLFGVPDGQAFIDPQPLTEQAAENDSDAATDELLDDDGLEEFAAEDQDGDLGATSEFESPSLPPQGEGGGGAGGTNVVNGTPGDDNLVGAAGSDILHGFAGNDTLDGGAGSDRLDGGLGDDVLLWDSSDVAIDGKGGIDTLLVSGGDADFTSFAGALDRLEIVDLATDSAANKLTLSAQDVIDATDNGYTLTVLGGVNDSLDAGAGWTFGGVDGGGNDIYTQVVGAQTATLVVAPAITVNGDILV